MKNPKLTFGAFSKWFKGQKVGTKKYDYCSNSDCLVARFVRAQGFEEVNVAPLSVLIGGASFKFPKKVEVVSHNKPWTYRAARQRLRKIERGERVILTDD